MYAKPVLCTSVHKASLLYKCTQNLFTEPVYKKRPSLLCKCTQNQFTVQVNTKLVGIPEVISHYHKTSLIYKFTQNQFIMQVYTKPVYCANVQKGWTETDISILIMKGMYRDGTNGTLLRNVQGQNITKECTWTERY